MTQDTNKIAWPAHHIPVHKQTDKTFKEFFEFVDKHGYNVHDRSNYYRDYFYNVPWTYFNCCVCGKESIRQNLTRKYCTYACSHVAMLERLRNKRRKNKR